MPETTRITLSADTNQARGIAEFAIGFMSDDPARRGEPDRAVLERTELFHADACLCGVSALALGTSAPTVLRAEALQYPSPQDAHGPGLGRSRRHGATVFGLGPNGAPARVKAEKAILANGSAVREWDSNGTNFGYNPELGHTAGEFGHNDFYPVPIAAAQMLGADGATALRGMILLDEIRGRLAEVFSLKDCKIDHVVHGAIASCATFGAMLGATAEQIESAIGMVVAHYIPFRAIRAGKQLSDSKGASAAISTEMAILSVKRSMAGFVGPADIFRNPEAIFRLFQPTSADASPFDLVLTRAGADFAVMGMHFKLGLYEHQSAGALQAMLDLLTKSPEVLEDPEGAAIDRIRIVAYQPAFGIIGDPAKRNPTTRQSADHSMVYIIATLLRKALGSPTVPGGRRQVGWKQLMLEPADYSPAAIADPLTRRLMDKIEFAHGGPEYDRRYPDGIPTSVIITGADGKDHDSGLVMYPAGHARNTSADLRDILTHKFTMLARLATSDPAALVERFSNVGAKSADEINTMHDFELPVGGAL